AAALRQGVRTFPEKIRRKEKEIDKIKRLVERVQDEDQEPKKKPRGFLDSLAARLDGWANDNRESALAQSIADLDQLKETYEYLSTAQYSNRAWTFVDIDEEITRLYKQLTGAYSSLTLRFAPALDAQRNSNEVRFSGGTQEIDLGSIASFFTTVSALTDL